MSGFGADRTRRFLAALSLALLVPLGACSGGDEPQVSASPTPSDPATVTAADPSETTVPTASTTPTLAAPRNVIAEVIATLDARATALQFKDSRAFMSLVDATETTFVADQQQYWDNLSQLPLAEVSYVLDPASVVRTGDRFAATVDLHLELKGYDSQPALSRGRMEFARGPRGLQITAAQTGDDQTDGGAQPWDLGPIHVRTQADVLGVFDAGSVAAAPAVLKSVRHGIADVRQRVPANSLSSGAVVYALSDLTFLQALEKTPGTGQDEADGLTFTVAGVDDGPAASRIVLDPTAMPASDQARDRLVRHELTHVATGPLGSGVPLWLSEGSAEWVSVQALSPKDRAIPMSTIDAARRGVDGLPPDSAFTGDRTKATYGISWWACEYIARTYGDRAVWLLISEFERAGADADQAQVIQRLLGITPQRIARGAEQMILAQYAPRPKASPPVPSGSSVPSEPPVPSDDPSDAGAED